jgi:hypothetical protein
MRPRFLIVLFVTAVVVLLVILWFRPVHSPSGVKEPQAVGQTGGVPVPTISRANPVPGSNSATTQPSTRPQSITANPNGLQDAMQRFVDDKNQPISFHGEVIDQDSNALTGVQVKSSVEEITIPDPLFKGQELVGSKYVEVSRTTDAAGRFEISGLKGDGFGVTLKKEGYEAESDNYGFAAASGDYANPVIFKMWSTNVHEQLISGKNSFPIVPDGRPYFINLAGGTISESGTGDLRVWVKRPEQVTHGQRYDWSCEVDALDGALALPGTNDSMYVAPAGGYTPSFQFEQTVGGGWGDSTGPRQFYVKLNNGQEYGRITVELFAYYNNQNPGMVRLSYAINPSGSRTLR